jgi:YfiH family protein
MSIYYKIDGFLNNKGVVKHGFFGAHGGVSKGVYSSLNCNLGGDDDPVNVKVNRHYALGALGIDDSKLYGVKQVHGSKCIVIDPGYSPSDQQEGDALITDIPGQTLSILTADCVPVLFYGVKDNGAPVIAAAHAGWKGALAGILENTVKGMLQKGAKLETLRAAIGPAIGPESYEVGSEFRATFIKKNSSYEDFFKEQNAQVFFNLPAFCRRKLEESGVPHIFHKNLDTFFQEDDFFSYRRSTQRKDEDCGRQISLISIAE